jgi:cardiolipin synthase A/B
MAESKIYKLSRLLIHSLLVTMEKMKIVGFSRKSRSTHEHKVNRDEYAYEMKGHADDLLYMIILWRSRKKYLKKEIVSNMGRLAIEYVLKNANNSLRGCQYITEWIGVKFTEVNSFKIYTQNALSFEARLSLISQAKKTILTCYWCVNYDGCGKIFAEHLIQKAKAGVEVRLLLDKRSVLRSEFVYPDYPNLLAQLTQGGVHIHYLEYEQIWESSHRKLLIIDDNIVMTGGRNIGDEYTSETENALIDVDIVLNGPIAIQAKQLFYELSKIPYSPDISNNNAFERGLSSGLAAFIDHKMNFEGQDPIYDAIMIAIETAKKQIDLCFAYVVVFKTMREALIRAAKRGVKVRILTNSDESTDYPMLFSIVYPLLIPLIDEGIEVFLMKKKTLHAKFAVFDAEFITIGSHNLWPLSNFHLCETNLFLWNPQAAQEFIQFFDSCLSLALKIKKSSDYVFNTSNLVKFFSQLMGDIPY